MLRLSVPWPFQVVKLALQEEWVRSNCIWVITATSVGLTRFGWKMQCKCENSVSSCHWYLAKAIWVKLSELPTSHVGFQIFYSDYCIKSADGTLFLCLICFSYVMAQDNLWTNLAKMNVYVCNKVLKCFKKKVRRNQSWDILTVSVWASVDFLRCVNSACVWKDVVQLIHWERYLILLMWISLRYLAPCSVQQMFVLMNLINNCSDNFSFLLFRIKMDIIGTI